MVVRFVHFWKFFTKMSEFPTKEKSLSLLNVSKVENKYIIIGAFQIGSSISSTLTV